MPYKVEGTTNDSSKVIVVKEDDWAVEKTEDVSTGAYEIGSLASGTKLVSARRDTDGEVISYGSVSSIFYAANYFGDGSDGDITISSNTNLVVPNKVGSYDGDMVVMNYNTLTIDSGYTLTTDQPGRGLFIYVLGDCVINGTLSMTARGAFANPTVAGGSDSSAVSATGLRYPVLKSGETDTLSAADFAGCGNDAVAAVANQMEISGNGKIYTLVRQGAAGGGAASGSPDHGNPGSAGGVGQTGGGGSGGSGSGGASGAGSYGSCFGGGSAGGGSNNGAVTGGTAWGGAGGNGASTAGGGSGNPGGTGANAGDGSDGNGGLIVLVVGGNLTIGPAGILEADGLIGGTSGGGAGGGSSGGGNVLSLYKGSLTNNGTVRANGGAARTGGLANGGAGGAGSVQGPIQIF